MSIEPEEPKTDIFIAGTGYLGIEIGRLALNRGFAVTGLVKRPESVPRLRGMGITPLVADLQLRDAAIRIPKCRGMIICLAPDSADEDGYRRIYLDAVGSLIEACKSGKAPGIIVYVSSTGVWKDRQGQWVHEHEQPDGETEKSRILAGAETQVLESGLPAVILRLAGIYGPGRNRWSRTFFRKAPESRQPDRFINLIHVEDAARACLHLVQHGEAGTFYTGVDREPVRESEFEAWLRAAAGAAADSASESGGPAGGKRCAAERLEASGFQWKYPSFRQGYQPIITTEDLCAHF